MDHRGYSTLRHRPGACSACHPGSFVLTTSPRAKIRGLGLDGSAICSVGRTKICLVVGQTAAGTNFSSKPEFPVHGICEPNQLSSLLHQTNSPPQSAVKPTGKSYLAVRPSLKESLPGSASTPFPLSCGRSPRTTSILSYFMALYTCSCSLGPNLGRS